MFSFSSAEDEDKKAEQESKAVVNFVQYWNMKIEESGSKMKKVRLVSPERKEAILRIFHMMKPADVARAINTAMNSPFCNGDTKTRTHPVDFDWLMKPDNFTRLLEGAL